MISRNINKFANKHEENILEKKKLNTSNPCCYLQVMKYFSNKLSCDAISNECVVLGKM